MKTRTINLALTIILFVLPILSAAQNKDVTQFLGIPVDGLKTDMIEKLKEKGFRPSQYKKEILTGEFNGIEVNIHIVTNNNKVCRIMVSDVNNISETDIKIRFNKLISQFQKNQKYASQSDSTISQYIIPDDEDISYEILANKKRYEAVFYQKAANYDSLATEAANLLQKDPYTDKDKEQLRKVLEKMLDLSYMNKVVWFMISEFNGKYYISMFYDNQYNRADGDDL